MLTSHTGPPSVGRRSSANRARSADALWVSSSSAWSTTTSSRPASLPGVTISSSSTGPVSPSPSSRRWTWLPVQLSPSRWAVAASSRASSVTGSVPGMIGCSVHHSGSLARIGSNPARTSEDLPHPDGPTTSSAAFPLRTGGERSSSASSLLSCSRPKNTRCCSTANGKSPGKGDRSSGQPAPPAASSRRNSATISDLAATGSRVRSMCCSASRAGSVAPGSVRSGNSRLPRLRATSTSAAHHRDCMKAVLTMHMTTSAHRNRSCSRARHCSPAAIPFRRSRSRKTSWPSSTNH